MIYQLVKYAYELQNYLGSPVLTYRNNDYSAKHLLVHVYRISYKFLNTLVVQYTQVKRSRTTSTNSAVITTKKGK